MYAEKERSPVFLRYDARADWTIAFVFIHTRYLRWVLVNDFFSGKYRALVRIAYAFFATEHRKTGRWFHWRFFRWCFVGGRLLLTEIFIHIRIKRSVWCTLPRLWCCHDLSIMASLQAEWILSYVHLIPSPRAVIFTCFSQKI